MSKTFMRGLALLETIDFHGPLTVAELSRLTGIEKSIVSRTLSACEPDGWIARLDGRITLGPRATLLAHTSPMAGVVRQAQALVEAIAGVTGFSGQAYARVGARSVLIATAGSLLSEAPIGLATSGPLYGIAGGTAIAAQLDASTLDRLLPPDPLPHPLADLLQMPTWAAFASTRPRPEPPSSQSKRIPRTRAELDQQLERVRADGVAFDHADLDPELACIAIPWPRPTVAAALACMGSPAELAAAEPLARAVLSAAAAPAATRADIAAAAAHGAR